MSVKAYNGERDVYDENIPFAKSGFQTDERRRPPSLFDQLDNSIDETRDETRLRDTATYVNHSRRVNK